MNIKQRRNIFLQEMASQWNYCQINAAVEACMFWSKLIFDQVLSVLSLASQRKLIWPSNIIPGNLCTLYKVLNTDDRKSLKKLFPLRPHGLADHTQGKIKREGWSNGLAKVGLQNHKRNDKVDLQNHKRNDKVVVQNHKRNDKVGILNHKRND